MNKKIGVILLFICYVIYANGITELKPELWEWQRGKIYSYEEYLEIGKIYEKSIKDRTKKEQEKLSEYSKYNGEYSVELYNEEIEYYVIGELVNEDEYIVSRYYPIPYKAKASSFKSKYKEITYDAKNLYDCSRKTAWVEGKTGDGIGEYVEYYMNAAKYDIELENEYTDEKDRNVDYKGIEGIKLNDIDGIYIYNGYQKSEKVWKENSRVKKLKMYVQGREYAILNLEDSYAEQKFVIPPIKYMKEVKDKSYLKDLVIRFEIMEVYKGEKYDDTVISDILFQENEGFAFKENTKVMMANGSLKEIKNIKVGDKIATLNNNKIEIAKVIDIDKEPIYTGDMIVIDFGDMEINTTEKQVFFTEKGLKAFDISARFYYGYENINVLEKGDKIYFVDKSGKMQLKKIKNIERSSCYMCYTITKLENGDNFIADGAVVGVEEIEKTK